MLIFDTLSKKGYCHCSGVLELDFLTHLHSLIRNDMYPLSFSDYKAANTTNVLP